MSTVAPIGIFDSGLGGLVMTRAFRAALPDRDFLYLGDTLHVPYGPRSAQAIYEFTQQAVEYLFEQGCPLVVIACNTASANALRRLQQQYLPQSPYKDRRVLGVIVPTIEAAIASGCTRIGLIGTAFTVNSGTYPEELQKINPEIQFLGKATPLLVPLVENNGLKYAEPVLRDYLEPLLAAGIDSLILGCTHYPLFKPLLAKLVPEGVDIISQDDMVPAKLVDYLKRHPEIDKKISLGGRLRCLLTDVTSTYTQTGADLLGEAVEFEKVVLGC